MPADDDPLVPGARVEYLEDGVFDQLLVRGDVGVVVGVDGDWVRARWPRSDGDLAVPLAHVRRLDG